MANLISAAVLVLVIIIIGTIWLIGRQSRGGPVEKPEDEAQSEVDEDVWAQWNQGG